MKDSQALIKWFWLEFKKAHRLASYDDGLCQCESDHFIEGTDRPEIMRSFLILSVFIDQMMFTHFQSIYQEFRSHFYFPKLYSHPESGTRMASPCWFIYSLHGFDKKMNWASALPVANAVLGDLFGWLKRYPDGKELLEKFKTLMEMEMRTEFETEGSKKLLDIISQTRIFDGL